jgi:hypothetical protein
MSSRSDSTRTTLYTSQAMRTRFFNGDSGGKPIESYSVPHILRQRRTRGSDYRIPFGDFVAYIPEHEPELKSPLATRFDPVKQIAKLTGVEKEIAQKIVVEVENDIDQICKEEKIELLDSNEKAEFISGMIRAVSNFSKRLSKQLK